MNNQMFDPMAMDFALKQMKQIQKETSKSLLKTGICSIISAIIGAQF